MWKRLKLWSLVVVCLLPILLSTAPALADTSLGVTISAVGYVCGVPGDFTLTYVNDYEVGISWVKGTDAENTMIRAAFGHVPENVSDGYQVYYGSGTSTSDTAISLAAPDVIYYRAWSQNTEGVWNPLFASGDTGGFMSASFLFVGLLIIAIFLTWMSSKRPEILVRLAAGLTWMATGFWLVLGDVTNLPLTAGWTQILVWVFFMMAAVPFLFQMNTEITTERKGQKWTAWGDQPPGERVSGYDDYKKRLLKRTRGRR